MVGDNEISDIIGTKALGLAACLYDSKQQYQNHGADFYVNDFKEIPDLGA